MSEKLWIPVQEFLFSSPAYALLDCNWNQFLVQSRRQGENGNIEISPLIIDRMNPQRSSITNVPNNNATSFFVSERGGPPYVCPTPGTCIQNPHTDKFFIFERFVYTGSLRDPICPEDGYPYSLYDPGGEPYAVYKQLPHVHNFGSEYYLTEFTSTRGTFAYHSPLYDFDLTPTHTASHLPTLSKIYQLCASAHVDSENEHYIAQKHLGRTMTLYNLLAYQTLGVALDFVNDMFGNHGIVSTTLEGYDQPSHYTVIRESTDLPSIYINFREKLTARDEHFKTTIDYSITI